MNFEQQEMRYGLDPEGLRIWARWRYARSSTTSESETNTTPLGLDPTERKKIIDESRLDYECAYDLYIALALLKYQDWECVVAPYNFG